MVRSTLGLHLFCCDLNQNFTDYLHLTKRFGIVAASQIPLHYMLALKSPYSPLQILTRLSHESINVTHQLLGRIVTFLLYAHAALYLNFYVQKNLLGSKLQEAYIICGIVGIICFTIVGTTALSPVRRWSYRVFYITHVVLATVLLPVLFFHVSYIRIYLYETAAIYILNAAMRFVNTGTYTGTITHVDETNLLGIQVPLSAAKPNGRLDTKWEPGQHVYLSLKSHPLMRTFRSNPFTVASLPAVDRRLRFVARILDGNTATLARSVKEGKAEGSRVGLKQSITLEGPYGIPTHADRLLRYDRVLFVAGGVGATFIVPLYRQLLSDLSPSKGSYRRTKVQFVWAVRSAMEVQWALPEDGEERRGFAERAKIYITGDGGTTFLRKGHNSVVGYDDEVPKEPPPDMEDGIELEEQQNLLSSRPDRVALADTGGLHFRSGRPNLARLVDGAFSHGITEKVAILVCGPRSLSCSLRREVGRWVYRERDVWFWDESFGL